jgi:hypothetical protein
LLFKDEYGCTPPSFRMPAAQQWQQAQPADNAPSDPLA